MSTEKLFLDTAFVQAILNPHDQYNSLAQELFPRVRAAAEVWVTEAVLTEVGNALAHSHRSKVSEFIDSCYTTSNIQVIPVDSVLFQRAVDFYRSRPDKEWGLTDCISFVVMQDQGLIDALTTDGHFRQAGFRALLSEESQA